MLTLTINDVTMDAHYDVEVIRANAAALYLRREPAAIISQIMEIQAFLVNAICRKRPAESASHEKLQHQVQSHRFKTDCR